MLVTHGKPGQPGHPTLGQEKESGWGPLRETELPLAPEGKGARDSSPPRGEGKAHPKEVQAEVCTSSLFK